jgi:integral membrane protein
MGLPRSISTAIFGAMKRNIVSLLRKVGMIEGVSLLVLLFIAMPLKYIWHQPMAVKIIGWLHGGLFVLFIWLAIRAYSERGWPFKKLVLAFVAAFLPFGTFVFDKKLKEEERLVS